MTDQQESSRSSLPALSVTAAGKLEVFRERLAGAPILIDLQASSLREAVEQLAAALAQRDSITDDQRDRLVASVMKREAEQSTTLAEGIVVPHAFLDDLDGPRLAVARLAEPLDLGAPDGQPSRFIYLLAGGRSGAGTHLELLMSIARLTADSTFTAACYQVENAEAWLAAVDAYLLRVAEERAPKVERPDGLDAQGFMRGVIDDLKRRAPHYISDYTDGLHAKSVAATMFLFFACIAPAVAFGGLMSELTGGSIGAMEMIVATAIGGVIYAVASGQPLTILGGTGPLLVFTGMIFEMCTRLELPFLPVYAWVGLWTAAFTVLAAITNGSGLIKFCTRFTDEIFALLISAIFIYEAVKNVLAVFRNEAVDDHSQLMSLVLALMTFYVAVSLRNFRTSSYLRHRVREFFADFGSVIAIGLATAIAVFLHEEKLPALVVPETFATTSGRPWLVNIFDLPLWVIAAAIIPALLCTVLVFLDQNITSRLVNQPLHKLEKGPAYHHDLLVVGGLIGVFSMFGLPWLVAATVRSLNHIRALANVKEKTLKDGTRRADIVSVRENRVTGLGIHLLIGASVLVLPWMKRHHIEIPMAVLFGLFLYMGVTSLGGNQFFERIKLWAMDPALYPATHYVRKVPLKTVHIFTALQLTGLAVLWFVKTSALALVFPLFIALLVPFRLKLAKYFEPAHLALLDSEEEVADEELRETE